MIPFRTSSPASKRHKHRQVHRQNTILLVEDDSLIRQTLKAILEYAGYQVLCASGGSQAITLSAYASFDMLITECYMPDMNGFLLAERLTERQARLPVLIVSISPENSPSLEEIVYRHWNYLPRPIDRVRLLEIVAESLPKQLTLVRTN